MSKLPREAAIVSSVATRHYGVSALWEYDPAEDAGQPIHKDDYTGQDRVKKVRSLLQPPKRPNTIYIIVLKPTDPSVQMTWYIYQGEDLKRDQKVVFPFYQSIRENYEPDDLVFYSTLIQCEAIRPVKYPTEGVTKKNCSLKADLRSVPRDHFRRQISFDGKPYYDIDYNLVVTVQSAAMKFSLEINEQELGSVEARYD